jgi:hypothetical protein
VVFGAAMIVVHNARTDRARLEAKLDELVQAVARGATATATPYPTERSATATAAGGFIAGASAFHDPSCRLVQGRDDVTFVSAADAKDQGLKPCRVCKPAAATAN